MRVIIFLFIFLLCGLSYSQEIFIDTTQMSKSKALDFQKELRKFKDSISSTLRKALAIGADKAIRINHNPKDGHSVAKYISNYISNNSYDLIIAGRESIDYNGGMVPGMISAFTDINFIDKCIDLNISGDSVEASREIEGGKENISTKLPLIIGGQKGLVEESDLRIPNMRGIMMARKKELEVVEVNEDYQSTNSKSFEKPLPKGEVTLISADEIDKLIDLLHNEAKAI